MTSESLDIYSDIEIDRNVKYRIKQIYFIKLQFPFLTILKLFGNVKRYSQTARSILRVLNMIHRQCALKKYMWFLMNFKRPWRWNDSTFQENKWTSDSSRRNSFLWSIFISLILNRHLRLMLRQHSNFEESWQR